MFFTLPAMLKKKTCAGRMFSNIPEAGYGPKAHFLPREECFSFFQLVSKRKYTLEGCFSFFQ
jgi:hypothetical protein